MKLTRKQTEIVRQMTKRGLVGKQVGIITKLGYYQPSHTNWCYVVGWTAEGDLVCTRFDKVMGWQYE